MVEEQQCRSRPQVIHRTRQPQEHILETRKDKEQQGEGYRHHLVMVAPVTGGQAGESPQEQDEHQRIEHIEHLLAQQTVKELDNCVYHQTTVEAQIVMPLADHDVAQRVDGFKGTEDEDIVPVVATHGREAIEQVHHNKHRQQKNAAQQFEASWFHAIQKKNYGRDSTIQSFALQRYCKHGNSPNKNGFLFGTPLGLQYLCAHENEKDHHLPADAPLVHQL